ncbi:MAG: hypothetical protein Q9218_007520 [Villophora microphyllina]
MTTDSIGDMTYNLPLQPAWQAEENYDFSRYHVPGCKKADCDGKCGLGESKKRLYGEKMLRVAKDRERRQEAVKAKGHTSGTIREKMEEPGDEDFVMGMKTSPVKDGNMLKGAKKARVTFAE